MLRRLRSRLLGISHAETSFARRGFHESAPWVRAELERHGAAFVAGFNHALAARDDGEFAQRARAVDVDERGFAYEGGGMALALLDLLALGRGRRLEAFLRGAGVPHVYMVHVGAGWALARLRQRGSGRLRGLDPFLRWLTLDGYGFHQGFFASARYVRQTMPPHGLTGYARRGFDQGLGRSLWFVDGADIERIASSLERFPLDRRGDLWSGVGLAAAYAGAVDEAGLERLAELAGPWRGDAAQGAAFAATARVHAGNLVPHTSAACEVLCRTDAEGAAAVVTAARRGIGPDGDGVGYELWRARIRAALAVEPAPV